MDILKIFEDRFGPAGKPLSMLIRPAITAPKGRTLIWGDWAAIEARNLPWLADSPGAREVLEIFRACDADPSKPDIYMREAGNIRNKRPEDVDADERQEGKVAVLALGFGGGVGALQAMAANYGLSFTDEEAMRIVGVWRENNLWARRFWDECWEAFQNAMESPGSIYPAGKVCFVYDKDYMKTVFMFLPDGRPIAYPNCRWTTKEVELDDGTTEDKYGLYYRRGDEMRSLWYGVIAENATQGTAGSRLREALTVLQPAPLLDAAGAEIWPEAPGVVVGHTHDEIIVECDDTEEAVEAAGAWLADEMNRVPDWLEGCPMAAELSTNWYYTKAKGVAASIG